MTEELYKRYRPTKLTEVVGQPTAIATLKDMAKRNAIPHTLLFSGGSGCGKTTLARILRHRLGCADTDYNEVNSARFRGIDTVREIQQVVGLAALGGRCRVWVIDECHQLTGPAQDAFLKLLEDTPPHVYFILCTTDPQKLKKTIRTRCTEVRLEGVSQADLVKLLAMVDGKEQAEGTPTPAKVLKAIAEAADGSPRKALVLLHQVLGIPDEAKQLEAVKAAAGTESAFRIAQALHKKGTTWGDMCEVLNSVDLDKEDIEGLRYMILAYATKVMLGGGSPMAVRMLEHFEHNFYDSKKYGFVLACHRVIVPR
jgi:DNA polymerase III subunit gamma/tau